MKMTVKFLGVDPEPDAEIKLEHNEIASDRSFPVPVVGDIICDEYGLRKFVVEEREYHPRPDGVDILCHCRKLPEWDLLKAATGVATE